MKTRIQSYDAETGTVTVHFREGAVTHKRPVNAVHRADGSYDRSATRSRVADVAKGVAHKIALGVIA